MLRYQMTATRSRDPTKTGCIATDEAVIRVAPKLVLNVGGVERPGTPQAEGVEPVKSCRDTDLHQHHCHQI